MDGALPSDELTRLLGHTAWLRRLAQSLVGSGAADDLVQDTLITAMRSPPDTGRPARPWLAAVLRNLARMQYRGQSRRARRDEASELAPAAAPRPDEHAGQLEAQRALCEVLLEVPEPYRRTLMLHYYDGLTLAEIARRDAVPMGTVRWRHKEAIALVRSALDRRSGGDRNAWLAGLAPLVGTPAGGAATATILGGLLVKKIIVIALVLAAGILVAWRVSSGTASSPRDAGNGAAAKPPVRLRFGAADTPPRAETAATAAVHGRVDGAQPSAVVRVTLLALIGLDAQPSVVAQAETAAYAFDGLRPGAYCVVAEAGAARASACDLVLEPGDRVQRDLALTTDAARLHGHIHDAAAGMVPTPIVIAQDYPQLQHTWMARGDADGSFALRLPPGGYRLTIRGDGYSAATRQLELDGDRELVVYLQPAGQIAGHVVDRDSGAAVPRALVTMESADGASERTVVADDLGAFTVADLLPGHYSVAASLGDRISDLEKVALPLGGTGDVTLALAPSTTALRGRVVEADGERPIAGARVELGGTLARAVETDAKGEFIITGLRAGEYELAAIADGFVRATVREIVGAAGKAGIVLALPEGGAITGVVRLPSGVPVAGAVVQSTAWNVGDPRLADVRTDADGRFHMAPMPPGKARLSAFHPAHGVTELVDVAIAAGGEASTELVFAAASSINGVVRYEDGSPAAAAWVEISQAAAPATWTAVVGQDGRFAVSSLPAGVYHVSARPATSLPVQSIVHASSHTTIEVANGQTHEVTLEVPDCHETIRGHVVDDAGRPVVGAAVWAERQIAGQGFSGLSPADARVYTWSDGGFELTNLPRGKFSIYAADTYHATGMVPAVAAGAGDVTVVLPATASLAGQVVRTGGAPATAFRIRLMSLDRSSESGTAYRTSGYMFVDPDGHFELPGLEPSSRYEVAVDTAEGEQGALDAFALVPGEHKTDLLIEVVPLGTLRGRLVDAATSAPAIGMRVSVGLGRGGMSVDGTGHFEGRVAAGTYEVLYLSSEQYGMPGHELTFEVKPGQTTDLGELAVEIR